MTLDEKDENFIIPPPIAPDLSRDDGIYFGDVVNGKAHGKGKYFYKNGNIYEGDFVNDKWHGNGKLLTFTLVYKGDFIDGKFNGKGILTSKKGIVYEGDFVDKPNGKGKIIYSNGNVYEGDFVDGKHQGKGKITSKDGDVYEGDWVDSKYQGKGKYTWKDGNVYEGDWVDGKRHGQGKLICQDRTVKEGKWIDGIFEGDINKDKEIQELSDYYKRKRYDAKTSIDKLNLFGEFMDKVNAVKERKLLLCWQCNGKVSSEAKLCPHCGDPHITEERKNATLKAEQEAKKAAELAEEQRRKKAIAQEFYQDAEQRFRELNDSTTEFGHCPVCSKSKTAKINYSASGFYYLRECSHNIRDYMKQLNIDMKDVWG